LAIVDIYCRVSTDGQEENSSFDEQERAGREFCQENGLTIGLVHREVFSGYQYRERAKLDLMRQRYREGKIQGVVIRNLDRLSRNQVHNAILMEEMEHHEVVLYCVKENIDDTPMGKFIRMVLAFVGEMEREKFMDRGITGRINKAKEGKIVGGKNPRYGWCWHNPVAKDYLILDEDQAEILKWAAEEYARGIPCLTLVKQLVDQCVPSPSGEHEWTPRTLRRLLEDRRNTGTGAQMFVNPKKGAKQNLAPVALPDGTYPMIFSMELYDKVLARAATNQEDAARNGHHPEYYLLRAGFIKCAECGHAMIGIVKRDSRWNSETLLYACQRNKGCQGQFVPSPQLDKEIWAEMVKLADHVSLIEQAIQLATRTDTIQANLRAVDATVTEWQQAADNYTEDLQDRTLRGNTRAGIRKMLDDANAVIERLEGERQQILAGAYDKERERQAYGDILVWCKKVKEVREELSYQQKRDFLRMLGVVVLVKKVNRNEQEMSYDIRVQLPSIQELLYQKGVFVGQSRTRRR